ncbi:MAG: type VI secretion system contractile sheath small subunit [Pseudomonadota bacterium]|nr:type VI secretion system contractile sheath small subunit [Pseudomonadota bacterium]
MSKREGIQGKLQRVRAPRVHLTYDVEIGGQTETKELPFVVGVMGEFTGDSVVEQPKLKDKKFVNIDLDNFDEVMAAMAPRAAFRTPNHLSGGGEFAVDLTFKGIDDFRPEAIVRQVEPLNALVEARARLADLRNKISTSEKLEDLLDDILRQTEKVKELGQSQNQEEHSND